MRRITRNIREDLCEFNRVSAELFAEDVSRRGQEIENAIDDGWYKLLLKGAISAGVVTAGLGYYNDSPIVTGFGFGMSTMAGLYLLLVNRGLKRREL